MSIPPENSTICLIDFETFSSTMDIRWMNVVLIPTNKPLYRVWSMNYSGFFLSTHKKIDRMEMVFVFTGTTSYLIDFEKFPITGTASINGKIYTLNGNHLSVTGKMGCFVNIHTPITFGPDCTVPNCIVFTYEFHCPVCISSTLFSINQNIYDNPGKEMPLVRHNIK